MKYSIVIPLKNEEGNITPLIAEIRVVMTRLNAPWELICVDDASGDQTLQYLKDLKKSSPFLKILPLSKSYGQSSAFKAGFDHALGEWIISLDGDGQNDPSDIPKLLAETTSYDMVVGWRTKRNDPLIKSLTSRISNKVRQWVCHDQFPDINCSLKVFRNEVYKHIKMFHGMHRFLPILFELEGARIIQVPVNHRRRFQGKSHYHFFNRSLAPFIDMFVVRWMRKRNIRYQFRE